MSTTTEKRVLDMQLKNQEFERNAAQTLSTLSKLKESLNFSGVSKGFDDVQKNANSLKFDRLISSVEEIESKFSALNIAAMTVFQNLVNKAINAGQNIVHAFAIEPITSGFSEYEQKLGSIQTILANTTSRQKEASASEIKAINDQATAATTAMKETQEAAVDALSETQAAQDKALQKQFQAQNKAFEKQASAQTKAFEKQASAKLEAFQKETEKEIDALNKSYETRYQALATEEANELALSEQNFQEKSKLLEQAQKNETKILEKQYKEQTKAYEKEMKNQIDALEDQFDAQTEALEDASEEQLDILEDQQEQELKALEKVNEAELKAVEDKYESQIDAAEDAAEKELDALEKSYNEQLDLLEETTDAQMDALEDYYDDAYDALEESQERESKLLEKEHDARLDMYHEEYMEKLKVADEDRYNQIKAIDDQIDSIKNLSKAEKEEREAYENRQKLMDLEKAVYSADSETERIRAERNLSDFRAKLAQEERDKQRQQQIEALEQQKDNINEQFELTKENLQAEYDQRKASEDEIYQTQKDDLNKLHQEQKEALKDQEESEKERLKKSIEQQKETLKEQYEYEKELAKERADLQKQNIQEQKEAEIEALKEQQEAAKEVLKDQQEDQKEALKDQIQQAKDALKDQQDLQKEALQEQQTLQKEAIQETYETQKQALQEQQELQREGLNNQNEQEKQAIQESFEARRTKLQEQQTKELTAIQERRTKEGEALQERIDKEREALNNRIDSERQALQDSQDAQKTALDKRQKAEMKALKERHKKELENIQTEASARIAALNQNAGRTTAPSLKQVNDALDELNKYSDQTIYNFAEMTRNIGTFTAAGVDLDTSVDAIKGIANLAALSGSNATQASTAMYQLSQAISTGTLRLEDWRSVENASMGGAQFRESLKETARAHGIAVDEMIAKEGSFRNSLQHGWLTSEVLLETLAKFTGDLTDEQLKAMGYTDEQVANIQKLANTAVNAATKVRTWSQLIDTTKEAIGSGWSETFEIIFGNFNEATKLWTKVSKVVGKVVDQQAKARNELLTGWKESGGRQDLIDAVANVWKGINEVMKPVKQAFTNIFPPLTVKNLVDFTSKLKDLTGKLKLSDKNSKNLRRTFNGLFSVVKVVKDIFVALFKAASPIAEVLGKIITKALEVTGDFGQLITKITKAAEGWDLFNKAAEAVKTVLKTVFDTIGGLISPIIEKVDSFREKIIKAFNDTLDKATLFKNPFKTLHDGIFGIDDAAGQLKDTVVGIVKTKWESFDTSFLSKFRTAWSDAKDYIETNYGGIDGILSSFKDKAVELGSNLIDSVGDVGTSILDFTKIVGGFTADIFSAIIDFFKDLPDIASKAQGGVSNFLNAAKTFVKTKLPKPDLSFITSVYDTIKNSLDPSKSIIENIKTLFAKLRDKLVEVAPNIGDALGNIGEFVGGISKSLGEAAKSGIQGFIDLIGGIPGGLQNAGQAFSDFVEKVKEFCQQHLKAPDLSFITDFLDQFFTTTHTMEKSQGDVTYVDIKNALFKDSDIDGMEQVLGTMKEKILGVLQWIRDNIKFDDVLDGISKVNIAILGLSSISMVKAFKGIADTINDTFSGIKEGVTGFFDSITGIFDNISGTIEEIKNSIIIKNLKTISKVILSLAVSIRIISDSIKMLSDIDPKKLLAPLGAISLILIELGGISFLLSKFGGDAKVNSLAILAFAEAMKMLVDPIQTMAQMDLPSLAKGVVSVMTTLASLGGASFLVGKGGFNASAGFGLLEMATSLLIVQKAIEKFAQLDINTIKKGGGVAAGAITIMSAAASAIGHFNFKASNGAGVLLLASSLLIVQNVMEKFGDMQLIEIGRGFLGLVSGLVPLVAAIIAVGESDATVQGSIALTVASVALIAIAKAVDMLGDIELGQVGTDLALFAGILGSIVIAAAATQPVLPGMLALAAAIGAVGIAAAGIGIGVTLFVAAMGALASTTEVSLAAVVAAFGILASSVLAVITGLLPQVGDLVIALIDTICNVVTESAPRIAETILTVIESLLDVLIDHIPSIADKIFLLLCEILDALTVYTPEIVTRLVNLITLVFAAVVEALKSQDTDILVEAIVGMILVESMMKKMAALSKIAPQAFLGIVEAGAAIVELGAVLAAIGALAQIPGLKWLLGEGISVLQTIGTAIGKFIGSIIGGILNGISAQLPEIAMNLCAFIDNLKPFLNKVSKVNQKQKKGVVVLFEIIALMTAASIIDSISKFFTLPFSYTRMGSQLSAFALAAQPFFKITKKLNAKAMKGVECLANAILKITANDVLDGLTAWFTGGNSLESFGAQLEAFGPHLKKYAEDTAGIKGSSVKASARAMKILADAADTVPNTGGKLADLIGDNALDDWGAQLEAFGPHLAKYAKDTAEVKGDSVQGSANAMKILAKAARVVPNTGGKLADLIGDNALDDWGAQLEAFGPHLAKYAADTEGITEDSVKGSANAMKILARAAAVIPNSGGLISFFTGDNTLGDFGTDIEEFGKGLAAYAEATKDVKAKKVEASARASAMLVDMATNIPNSGGILQAFFGEKNLETFSGQLLVYGQAIKKYNKKIQGIGTKEIEASAAAGQSLVALAENLPEDEGIFGKIFGGDKDLGSFGEQIKKFGTAMADYYTSIKDIDDTSKMTSVGSVANRMVDIAIKIQSTEIKGIKTLGGYIADLGDDYADYYDGIDDISFTQVDSSIAAIEKIVGLGTSLKDLNKKAFTNFSDALKALAEAGIEGFVDTFEDSYEEVTEEIKQFVKNAIKGIGNQEKDLKSAGKTLGKKVPSGFISGMNNESRTLNETILTYTGAIVTQFQTGLAKSKFETIGSDAVGSIGSGFSAPGQTLMTTINTLTGGIVKQFNSGLKSTTFEEMSKGVLDALEDGFSNIIKVSSLATTVSTLANNCKTSISSNLKYEDINTISVGVVNALIDGLNNGQYYLNDAARQIASGVITTLQNNMTYDQGKNVGVNVINGLIDGINNGSYYVNQAVRNVSSSAVQTFRESWDSHSPSKVTYAIGGDIDAGLADGISAGGRRVIKAAENVSEDTQESFEDLDEGMSQTFEDSIDLSNENADTLTDNVDTTVDSLGESNKTLTESSENVDKFSESLNNLSEPLEKFKTLISEGEQLLREFMTRITNVNDRLDAYETELSEADKKTQTLRGSIEDLNTALQNLATQMSNVIDYVNPLDTAVSNLTTTLQNVASAADIARQALANYNTEYANTNFDSGTSGKKSTGSNKSSSGYTDASVKETKKNTNATKDQTKTNKDTQKYTQDLNKAINQATKTQQDAAKSASGYKTSGSGTSSDGYHTGSGSGSGTTKKPTKTGQQYLDEIEQTVDDTITDAMRDKDVDLNVDLTTGKTTTPKDKTAKEQSESNDSLKKENAKLEKSIKENTKETKKSTKQSKSETKKKNKKSKQDDVVILDAETTSSIKQLAEQMNFGTTSNLVNQASGEIQTSTNKKASKEDYEEDMQKLLESYITKNNGTNQTPTNNIENTNVFNIRSTDPKQAADEIGVILQKQVDRGKAVWGT